jgi:hypothetical protein
VLTLGYLKVFGAPIGKAARSFSINIDLVTPVSVKVLVGSPDFQPGHFTTLLNTSPTFPLSIHY